MTNFDYVGRAAFWRKFSSQRCGGLHEHSYCADTSKMAEERTSLLLRFREVSASNIRPETV
jgi:hypothetical protein